jgi:hypothetical protein
MGLFSRKCHASDLVGEWNGRSTTDNPWFLSVSYAFKFNRDGTYSYSAGQGNFEWTSHRGEFQIKQARGGPENYPCLLTLTPHQNTVRNNPENKLGLAPLLARRLMGDKERRYFIRKWDYDGSYFLQDAEDERLDGVYSFSISPKK